MKIIFLLSLLLAVGAQDNDSSGADDENMSTPDDNMSSTEDDMMNSDEDGNMGGSGRSPSSSRKFPFSSKKDAMTKKMLKKLMNICLDVEFPKEMIDTLKRCSQEEAKKSSLLEDILDGNFPEKEEWSKMFESMEMCKLKSIGINDIDTDLNVEKFSEFAMFDKWTGDEKDIEELRREVTSCLESAQGSGFQKVVSINKCALEFYLTKCRTEDEEPGMLITFFLKLLTLFEEPRCTSVKISEETKQIINECIEESKNMLRDSVTQSSNTNSNKNVPKEAMKVMNLLSNFNKFAVQGLQQCMGNRTGTYDASTRTINMTGIADIVKNYEGWDGLEQERDQVYQALVDCGREYGDSSERDNDSEAERLKEIMEDNEDFDRCYAPKFAQICGYNNELGSYFDFMLNPELLGKLYAAFKEVGGKDVEDVINLLKAMLQKFKEQ